MRVISTLRARRAISRPEQLNISLVVLTITRLLCAGLVVNKLCRDWARRLASVRYLNTRSIVTAFLLAISECCWLPPLHA